MHAAGYASPQGKTGGLVLHTAGCTADGRRRERRALARRLRLEQHRQAGAGDEWKPFGGTTLNFISENTAPTSAIAANLKPFTDLTGIEVKISQLELTALVQKVALDFASGIGAYDVVYADPYQVLAPYHSALADLNRFNSDPNLPKVQDLQDF